MPYTPPATVATVTKALSVRQPFAEAILTGEKVEENRNWATEYRGPMYVHAATTKARKADLERFAAVEPASLVYGAIVGVTGVTECVYDNLEGCYVWLLANPRRLRKPVAGKGRLNLWTVPAEVLGRVTAG